MLTRVVVISALVVVVVVVGPLWGRITLALKLPLSTGGSAHH
jgi:hypothetical protein